MTSDRMSLSCQISCFPPDCIKENIWQLALGELLVQKKLRQQTSISLIFCIVPSNGTRQIDITPTAFFLLPSAPGNPRSPSGRLEHFTFIPIQSGPCVSSSEEQKTCQPKSSLQWLSCYSPSVSKPSKKFIAAIICLTIASLAGRGALLC